MTFRSDHSTGGHEGLIVSELDGRLVAAIQEGDDV